MRDRIARIKSLVRRGLSYWKVSLALFVVVGAGAYFLAKSAKLIYRAESVIEVKGSRSEGGENPGAKDQDRLQAIVQSRDVLEPIIKARNLYPKTVENKSIHDAAEDMKKEVGVRAGKSGLYTLGYQTTQIEGRDTQALVKEVTEDLTKGLQEEWNNWYNKDFLTDKKQKVEQLESIVAGVQTKLEDSTKKLTVFVMNHPQYQDVANKAAAGNPFGLPSNPLIEVPTPKQLPKDNTPSHPTPSVDPELQKIYQNDLQLAGWWREKQHLEAQLKAATGVAPVPTGVPNAASVADLKAKIEAAQTEVDAANTVFKEKNAAFQTAAGNYGPEHYEYKNTMAARDAAAGTLQAAKSKLGALQQQLKQLEAPAAVPVPTVVDQSGPNAEILNKLKDVNTQIGTRMEQLKAAFKKGETSAPPATSATTAVPTPVPTAPPSTMTPKERREKEIVDLEVEYRTLINELNRLKVLNDDKSKELEIAKTSLLDAQRSAGNLITIKEAPEKPLTAYSSKRMMFFMGGMALAFLLAILYPAARVALNDTIIDAADIEGLRLIPVIGIVPRLNVNATSKEPSGASAAANRGATGAV